ncbi:MAG: EMC3/TMCO1 family protein [Candidatus Nanohaloarchaea archaeon]
MIPVIGEILPLLYQFYGTVFQPLLAIGPYISLGFFSTMLALAFSLIYFLLVDREKMDEIKDKLSEHQEKMNEAKKNDEDDKSSEHMKKTMELNQKMMKLNLKPMIGTMVFVALIFPWLSHVYAPSIKMNHTGNNTFTGNLEYAGQNKQITVKNTSTPQILVGSQNATIGGDIKAFNIEWDVKQFGEKNKGFFSEGGYTHLKLNAKFIKLPFSIPLAGTALNWLGFYMIIIMPLTYIFRKLLGVQ